MTKNLRIGIIGSGSWATALAKMLCENVDSINWYIRDADTIKYISINHHNKDYLSSVAFDLNQLYMNNDINTIVEQSDILIIAIPSAFLKSELDKITVPLKHKIIFNAVKGIIPENQKLVGEYFHDIIGLDLAQIGVITGPCHAEEVALERLSYLTIACADIDRAKMMSEKLSCHYIKCSTSEDIIGTEYAAVLKNIYAIAAGIAHGLGYGDNFQSVLMSNAIREMKRFIKKRYKMKRNINDSAYLGDLLVTGYSNFSRNRYFGNMIGKGYTVKSAMMEMNMIAEGYYATESAYLLSKQDGKKKAKTPIINAVYKVIYKNKNPKSVFEKLTFKLN
ncbi:NAD(P)H-dependent glycerol-3-phosphate dehydrogenase [Mesohalobacter halotolerans]|jgi:glycerol-3-phosphate dehydrogenase (NAD(P)+)|uniref:Glycerol-3-phosphate dehydrogenase n=1 Tax=Mesohalobacter halotolerans TaxID=1883405 RepID=A0A4U5TQM6_9FLAO|nr:NAD(P)H-dependent glycerol-3-phosphate dehydrogenase [Mesohalobacter halotolerans]MBS3739002.1 NAD(P)H-dependent glycerol-3-phosphate dehydrogenase [Psychroflexus sp.]NBC57852.1 NAD(P)H-dependent glycerol-3-phosphate dehydrogenase [Bacteroidota bacterium]TKS55758.1 NAD(P)H-dependent glycerol-3-phosphate dehydrogenase [Mesohalobacter halotolerans]